MRLIDAIGLKQALVVSAILEDKKTIEQIIDEQPTIEPEHKTGRWIPSDSELEIKCNKCGKDFSDYVCSIDYVDLVERPKFCPNCGVDMRGEQNE